MPPRKKKGYMLGEAHYRSRLTAEQVAAIFLSQEKPIALALTYSVSLGTIYHIKNGQAWLHITKHLKPPPHWRNNAKGKKNG